MNDCDKLLSAYSADARTQSGQERLVLECIIKNGGFSVFWVMQSPKRGHAASRLESSGVITVGTERFPFHECKINFGAVTK